MIDSRLLDHSSATTTDTITRVEGVDSPIVLQYMNALNADDFAAVIALFASDGTLQAPFEKPIVGQAGILRYLREASSGLKLMPKQGTSAFMQDGLLHIKVTGKVQVPWLGAGLLVNVAWHFNLNQSDKIVLVVVKLLASPKELMGLAPPSRP